MLMWGYPVGIGIHPHEQNWPYVRGGIISQIEPWYRGQDATFVIDAGTYGGQSGSPVVLTPHVAALIGHKAVDNTKLVGMVCQRAIAPSVTGIEKTNSGGETEAREIVMETIGLGRVIPMKSIHETIEHFEKVILDRIN